MTPVAYLDSIGVLDDRFLAAHSINLEENDLDIYEKRGVKVSYNARAPTPKGPKGWPPSKRCGSGGSPSAWAPTAL